MKNRFRKQYIKIARKLTLADLQAGAEDNNFTMENILSAGRVEQSTNYFMGVFTKKGIKNVIDAFGLTEALGRLGLTDLQVDLDTSDPHTHRLYVYTGDTCDNNKICEMVVKKGPVNLQYKNLPKFPDRNPNFLQIEWLLLQNPRIAFDEIRPQLPGQLYPGLGIGDRMLQILIIMTRRLRLEGLVNKPRYYHTAFMFTKDFVFTNPHNQAILFSINRDLLTNYKFHTVAWAAHFDCIINHINEETLIWDSDYLILPLQKYMLKYFHSREYQKAVEAEMDKYKFIIDLNKFRKCMQKNKIPIYEKLV